MLRERRSQIATGLVLLAIGLLTLLSYGSRELVRHTRPHVEMDVSNVDGTVQIAVNCSQAAVVTTGNALELDLGFVPADDWIYVSTISNDRNPAWAYRLSINGDVVSEERRGYAKVPTPPSTASNAVVLAKAFTAAGEDRGQVGCQKPAVVSRDDVPGYSQSPDDGKVAIASAEESPFRPRQSPYAQVDALGRWAPPILAALGLVAAAATPPIRRLAWSHKRALATGVLAIVGAGLFQLAALPSILLVAGDALLFAVAAFLILGEPRARRLLRLS